MVVRQLVIVKPCGITLHHWNPSENFSSIEGLFEVVPSEKKKKNKKKNTLLCLVDGSSPAKAGQLLGGQPELQMKKSFFVVYEEILFLQGQQHCDCGRGDR